MVSKIAKPDASSETLIRDAARCIVVKDDWKQIAQYRQSTIQRRGWIVRSVRSCLISILASHRCPRWRSSSRAAKLRGDALDHLLIFGPPGCRGKPPRRISLPMKWA